MRSLLLFKIQLITFLFATFYSALSTVSRMAENNGSDATFSCVLWQKMDGRKVCQSMMVWGNAVR
ncbi:hypothetical protein RC88_06665 [Pectobacterium parvum]|nr:hypothetical protein RC88_06665 [Pectobacterium parvum]